MYTLLQEIRLKELSTKKRQNSDQTWFSILPKVTNVNDTSLYITEMQRLCKKKKHSKMVPNWNHFCPARLQLGGSA